jgi:hypothetical protein
MLRLAHRILRGAAFYQDFDRSANRLRAAFALAPPAS